MIKQENIIIFMLWTSRTWIFLQCFLNISITKEIYQPYFSQRMYIHRNRCRKQCTPHVQKVADYTHSCPKWVIFKSLHVAKIIFVFLLWEPVLFQLIFMKLKIVLNREFEVENNWLKYIYFTPKSCRQIISHPPFEINHSILRLSQIQTSGLPESNIVTHCL